MMNKILVILFCSLLFTQAGVAQTTYYLDDVSGNDHNSGTTVEHSWKTMQRLNQVLLKPGDSVLFRRGGSWIGNLAPKGSGLPGKRIVVGAYGNGPVPVIDANGEVGKGEKASYTIRLFNQEYIEFRDLTVRNFRDFETPREHLEKENVSFVFAPKIALYIEGRDCGTLHDIFLTNLEICNVNGDMSNKNNGGVFVEITWDEDETKRIKSNFDGLFTENCYIHDVDRTGWSNTSVWWDRSLHSQWGEKLADGKTHNWYPSRRIVLRNNRFEASGANALIVRVAEAPLVEHNLFFRNGVKGSGNVSFPFNCDNALFQYNEACYTVYNSATDSWNSRPDVDAGGFDSDFRCKNTVIQYNYSHHNGFGAILVCCDGSSKTSFNDGTVIRYNIFENNAHHEIRISGPATNTRIYNNVVFSGSGMDSVMLIYHKSWKGYSDSTAYLNNIFYSEGSGSSVGLGNSTRNFFSANLFYGKIAGEPEDLHKITGDPRFVNGQPPFLGWKQFLKFLLQEGSPAIDTGFEVPGHPGRDMLGTPVTGRPDRGALEHR